MTINTEDRKDGPYIGNGVTTIFPFNFKVFTSADLYVVLALLSTGGETVLALTTNYTVSLNADQNVSPGGTITTLTTYASTHSVTITSNIPNYQTMDLTNQGGFYPSVITNALDKATIQIQQLAEQANRALTLPVSSTASNLLPAPSASKALVWNTSATELTNADLTFTGETGSTIATFALLANATATLGQVINIAGHTIAGIGGGQFIAKAGSVTALSGIRINSATAGLYFERTNLNEYDVTFSGVLQDGTDQTTAITAWLIALGAAFAGIIFIPQNVKYNFNTVSSALPKRATVRDESGINAWDTAGFRQKFVGWYEGSDDTAINDLAFGISSGHNATMILDNRGTASSSSGQNRIAGLYWCSGRFTKGQPGYRDLARTEWSKLSSTKWFWVLRRAVPWIARDYEIWATGTAFTSGQYCKSLGGIYQATTTGTTGGTEPNWLKGVTSSDGAVSWLCINNRVDDSVFSINEDGEMATNASPTAAVVAYLKSNADSAGGGQADLYVEASNVSQSTSVRLRPTDGAGVVSLLPFWLGSVASALRLVNSTATKTLYKASDSLGFQLASYSKLSKTSPNLSTNPDVDDCGLLILANTGATNVTTLTTSFAQREVDLFFETANTTLVHNAGTFLLKGGVNVTPAVNTIITMIKYQNSAAWFEKGRSF